MTPGHRVRCDREASASASGQPPGCPVARPPAGTRGPGPLGMAGPPAVLERPPPRRARARPPALGPARGALVAVRLGSRAGTGFGSCVSLGPGLGILARRAWGPGPGPGSCTESEGTVAPPGTCSCAAWQRRRSGPALASCDTVAWLVVGSSTVLRLDANLKSLWGPVVCGPASFICILYFSVLYT